MKNQLNPLAHYVNSRRDKLQKNSNFIGLMTLSVDLVR